MITNDQQNSNLVEETHHNLNPQQKIPQLFFESQSAKRNKMIQQFSSEHNKVINKKNLLIGISMIVFFVLVLSIVGGRKKNTTQIKPTITIKHDVQILETQQESVDQTKHIFQTFKDLQQPFKSPFLQPIFQKNFEDLLDYQPNFCFILLHSEQKQLNSIIQQTYTKWQIIAFTQSQKQTIQPNIKYLNSHRNKGKDIYDGIVNHCSEQSIIILLKAGQQMMGSHILKQYSKILKNQSVVALLTPFIANGQKISQNSEILQFRRDTYFSEDNEREQINIVKNIIQNIRVFRASIYRKVPFIDLMYQNQTFYQSQVSFLFPILQMIIDQSPSNDKETMKYFHFPLKIERSNHPLFSIAQLKNDYNIKQINEIGHKMQFHSNKQTASWIKQYRSRYPLLWDRQLKLNALQRNITGIENQIPKLVHQIWIGGDIPYYKSVLMNNLQNTLKDYRYRLWKQSDITPENFPITFTYIEKLFQIHKSSKFSKLSMIADLMKYEIVYHHGGFYIDTNYELLQPLDHLRKYPFLGVIQFPAFFGQYIASSFFAAQKKSIYLQKLLSRQNLQDIDFDSKQANIQTGPLFLGKAFTLEDYYYSIKILGPQKMFPFMYWAKDQRWKASKCTFKYQQKIPKALISLYDRIIYAKELKVLSPCRAYSQVYGIDHWNLGGSWIASNK